MAGYYYQLIEANPIIAAIKDDEGLKCCCENKDIKVVFVLYGDLCNIADIVNHLKQAGKVVFVHVDLVQGLSAKEVCVDFIKKYTKAEGIITTRTGLAIHARELGFCVIMRFFILDSLALSGIKSQIQKIKPDFIEILPGVMPKIIKLVSSETRIPVIAGGLISDKEDVMNALKSGAIAISSSARNVWSM